ncbi:MAG: DNA repair protein RecO [Oscillospiraceae bacterium]|jgi:DNA repair protein RecO (recombination protein O)|nr:DNA repair protein RecO [Oscillospiraceae bacterium]
MQLQSEGLVLAAKATGEKDRLLTVLSKEYGVLFAYANGAQRAGSRLQGAAQPFCYGQFEFARRKDTYTLREAQPQEIFFALAHEPVRLALAVYFAQLGAALSPREEPAPEQLRLLLNLLHFLCEGTRSQALLKAVAELRLLSLAGFAPDMDAWDGEVPAALDCTGGRVLPVATGQRLPAGWCCLPPAAAAALAHICTAPLERLFRFAVTEEALCLLAGAAEQYLRRQWDGKFESLAYYRRLTAI